MRKDKRLKFTKKFIGLLMDMKWFYEVCAAGHEAEKDLQGSPLPPELLFRAKTGETKSQGIKVMFMACVSEHKKGRLWEMKKGNWEKYKTKGKDGAAGSVRAEVVQICSCGTGRI